MSSLLNNGWAAIVTRSARPLSSSSTGGARILKRKTWFYFRTDPASLRELT